MNLFRNNLDKLFYGISKKTRFDFVSEISAPLTENFVAELIGIPEEARPRIFVLINELFKTIDPGGTDSESLVSERASLELESIFLEIISNKRKNDDQTITTQLKFYSDLDQGQIVSTGVFLLLASHTNTSMLSFIMALAIQNRKIFGSLDKNSAVRQNLFSECVRFDNPMQSTTWFARQQINLPDRILRSDQEFLILNGAANRDPNKFLTANEFDPNRKYLKYLSFGYGLHFCLGFHLAKLFCLTLIEKVGSTRFPELEVDNRTYRNTYSIRSIDSLILRH